MEYIKPEYKHSKTAYRALTLSGISLLSAFLSVVFLPFILSPIAMIMSHLSKGRTKSKHRAAQAATVLAIIALIVNSVIIGYSVNKFKNDPEYRAKLDSVVQSLYGMSLDEYTNSLLNDLGVTLPE